MSCNCNQQGRIPSPIITVTPSLGSTASPYELQVTINQRLCARTCADTAPVFIPQFDVLSTTNVGGTQYMVKVQVQGAINYVKCGCGCCGTMSQPINATFSIPVTSATAPTAVIIAKGTTSNSVAVSDCQSCSRSFVSDNFVTLTVTTA